ncbi:hypothetical protein SynMITS9220_00064 [Synechococcus sp. MIT S9220]|nr:hypothetical protein SynMITS9220_00064 [Synechococcus sp. MIT S9220]
MSRHHNSLILSFRRRRRLLDDLGLTTQARPNRKPNPWEKPEDCNWSGTGHHSGLDS